jgi:peptidyl-prolyl cis-trans isomerase B (cyclophilin B)
VDAIEKVRTGNKSGHADVPLETVTIVRAVEIG